MNNQDLVIVTGASRGIGRAAVKEFANQGYQVMAVARTESLLRTLQEETGCLFFTGDVGEEAVVKDLFARVRGLLAAGMRLRTLVNNAGISVVGLIQDLSLREWDSLFRTNVTSMFLTCRESIPLFLAENGGSIVNVSSVWGSAGASCEAAYSASKGAVNAFTRALAKELAPSRIRVNAAAFGTIDTEMNAFLSADERRALEDEIGMGRFGAAEEAAKLIADLASAPEYLTGQIVTMDGAWI